MEPATAAGLILGIVGIVVSLLVAYFSRRIKQLSYQIMTNSDVLLQTNYKHPGALTVVFRDVKLAAPRLVVVRIVNDGKIEIRPQDFDTIRPITISTGDISPDESDDDPNPFGPGRIVTAGIAATEKDLTVTLKGARYQSIHVDPVLLNPGDWFDVQILADGPTHETNVTGRIAGGRLRRRDHERRRLSIPISRVLTADLKASVIVAMIVGLVVAAGSFLFQAPEVVVPDLVGTRGGEATKELRRVELHLESQTIVRSSESPGTVIDQHPRAGATIPKGDGVTIVVSGGP